jgi:hypothetical protein
LSRRVRRLEAKTRDGICLECAARECRYLVTWDDEPIEKQRCERCGAALDALYGIAFDDRSTDVTHVRHSA